MEVDGEYSVIHSFKSPFILGTGFWLLLNPEAFALVRREDREGLKE